MMATRKGLVKKTAAQGVRPADEDRHHRDQAERGDELVDVVVTKPGDEIILATSQGHGDPLQRGRRPPDGSQQQRREGHQPRGDSLVGMVVADPDATLLTACLNGYGKRTPFGPNAAPGEVEPLLEDADGAATVAETPASSIQQPASDEAEGESSSGFRYRTQNRGGKGLRDIKTTDRNGPVVSIVRVDDTEELLMMTARGKIQRIKVSDLNIIGRNTQGVRIMSPRQPMVALRKDVLPLPV
jgi:DNA gyrase subunit A